MKFDVYKDLITHTSYLKSRPDPVTFGRVEGGKPEILENTYGGETGMDLGRKNKHKSYIRDYHNQTDPLSFGEAEGGGHNYFSRKIRKK